MNNDSQDIECQGCEPFYVPVVGRLDILLLWLLGLTSHISTLMSSVYLELCYASAGVLVPL